MTGVEGDPKASFSIASSARYWESATPFLGLFNFTFDSYLIMLSIKQGGTKFHFLNF